ncbi:MAG: hydrogen gas-evolving membrane-bound hydrogenase subunit E [Halanaerobiales bacterium]
MKRIIAFLLLLLIWINILPVVLEMPTFGSGDSPARNLPQEYPQKMVEETGSLNMVSAIITDYRAFDTLGEAAVLFAAMIAVYSTLLAVSTRDEGKNKEVNNIEN